MHLENQFVKISIAGLVFVGVVLFGASYFVEQHKEQAVSEITLAIVEQEKTLSNIAEVTDRNGADSVVERIIVDCSLKDRVRFDELLGRLASVNGTELDEVDNLFDKCAGFYSERKAMMVARMEREYEVYTTMVDLLETVDDPITVAEYDVDGWGRLLDLEKRRSELFAEQVTIQKNIIIDLQAGETPTAKPIQEKMNTAREVAEELLVINKQSDEQRAKLLGL